MAENDQNKNLEDKTDINTQIEQLTIALQNFGQWIDESEEGKVRRETIEAMMEAEKIASEAHRSLMDQCTQMFNQLDNIIEGTQELEDLNDYISETERKMIGSTNRFMGEVQELKKGREEGVNLFNEYSKKTDTVNQWLKERTKDSSDDQTMEEEDSTDYSADLEKLQDVLGLRNGTEGSRKRQKLEGEGMSSPRSSTTGNKFSVLLVEHDTCARISSKKLLMQFAMDNNLEMEVRYAKTGKQAVDLHLNEGASFDLIFMDMDMPADVTSGPEATRLLQSLGVKSNIVGVTSESEKIDDFNSLGLECCIEKPPTDEKIVFLSYLMIPTSSN